jgi:hypothetical protein
VRSITFTYEMSGPVQNEVRQDGGCSAGRSSLSVNCKT